MVWCSLTQAESGFLSAEHDQTPKHGCIDGGLVAGDLPSAWLRAPRRCHYVWKRKIFDGTPSRTPSRTSSGGARTTSRTPSRTPSGGKGCPPALLRDHPPAPTPQPPAPTLLEVYICKTPSTTPSTNQVFCVEPVIGLTLYPP